MEHWDLQTLPGRRVEKMVQIFTLLAHAAPPRVSAALLRLVCNGFCTAHRFQQAGACRFCGGEVDSTRHLAFCPVVLGFYPLCSISPPPDRRYALDWLMGLEAPRGASTFHFVHLARMVYAIFRVHNALRYGLIDSTEISGAFKQYLQAALSPEQRYEETD